MEKNKLQNAFEELQKATNSFRNLIESEKVSCWKNDRTQSIEDGDYVALLPGKQKVFVQVENGEFVLKEYSKNFIAWLKLPECNF